MPNMNDGMSMPDMGAGENEDEQEEKEKEFCPACGKEKKEKKPNLAQVRKAIQDVVFPYESKLHQIEAGSELGYRGSVARGAVGNPNKTHYQLEPDIRGNCGIGYDVDAFMLSKKVFYRIKPDKAGKRWAKSYKQLRSLEVEIRSKLEAKPELTHMKKGAEGFEILVRHKKEKQKVFSKGGVIMLIFGV